MLLERRQNATSNLTLRTRRVFCPCGNLLYIAVYGSNVLIPAA